MLVQNQSDFLRRGVTYLYVDVDFYAFSHHPLEQPKRSLLFCPLALCCKQEGEETIVSFDKNSNKPQEEGKNQSNLNLSTKESSIEKPPSSP